MIGTSIRDAPVRCTPYKRHANERHAHGWYAYERHANGMDANTRHAMRERHTHDMHACGIHGRERGLRERRVHSVHVPWALNTPTEEEQLKPFDKLLESSVGASEVNHSEA